MDSREPAPRTGDDDVSRELRASALLMLFALGSPGLLLGAALGAIWLLA